MNNFRLYRSRFASVCISAVVLASSVNQAQADTLYGPLTAGETLSSIVNQNYLVSPFEDAVIMREIFRMNPQAFIYNNMGLIKQGVTLTLPSDSTLRSRVQQQPASNTVITTQPSARTRELTRSLEATLRQVRDERDQAKLSVRRVRLEATEKEEALNAKITQLESDKNAISAELKQSQAALKALKQSVEDLQREKSEQLAGGLDAETLKKLEASNRVITQKEQAIEALEKTVLALEAKAKESAAAHATALNKLQASKTDAETKLAAAQSGVDEVTKQHEIQIDELKRQHQTELENLQAKLDSQTELAAASSGNDEELSDLKQQHATEVAKLKAEHQQVISDLNATFAAQLAEKKQAQTDLENKLETLSANSASQTETINKLTTDNQELSAALDEAKAASEKANALISDNSITKQVPDNAVPNHSDQQPVSNLDDNDKSIAANDMPLEGPVTKEVLVKQLKKPVEFPLWGLLLGSFALGFTSLMMLFTRGRKQPVIVDEVESTRQTPEKESTQEEALVFKSADPNRQDPDIETLRVPPRRDPSRVAILDPTMTAGAVATTAAVAASDNALDEDTVQLEQSVEPVHEAASESDVFEAKLKLLMADAYEELGDASAANELLLEVRQEGNEAQIAAASEKINRLNH